MGTEKSEQKELKTGVCFAMPRLLNRQNPARAVDGKKKPTLIKPENEPAIITQSGLVFVL